MRGAYHDDENCSEPYSNLWQLLQSYADRDRQLCELLKKKTTYTSPEIQNELLTLMSNMVLRRVVGEINEAGWYSLMIDETPDISGAEQAVVCFRLVIPL